MMRTPAYIELGRCLYQDDRLEHLMDIGDIWHAVTGDYWPGILAAQQYSSSTYRYFLMPNGHWYVVGGQNYYIYAGKNHQEQNSWSKEGF